MFIDKKGYTLLETVISLFLISTILLGSAMGIKALGVATGTGVSDMVCRREINDFAKEMKNSISSFVSCQNTSYNKTGLVIYSPTHPENNSATVYKTTKMTMYTVGRYLSRDIRILPEEDKLEDKLQENKGLPLYGTLNIIDRGIRDENDDSEDSFISYEPIKITRNQYVKGKASKTEFVITTIKDEVSSEEKLLSIRVILLIPTAKGSNREFNMVFTCAQEVLVTVETE